MAANLRSKYNEWIIYFVLVPAMIALLTSLFFLWRMLRDRAGQPLANTMAIAGGALEQSLRSEALRLQTIASLPDTERYSLKEGREYNALQQQRDEENEHIWSELARDHEAVRSILDNELGLMFAQMVAKDPKIDFVIMVDRYAVVRAASRKPERYVQESLPWWRALRAARNGSTVSDGLSSNGVIGIMYPILEKSGRLRAAIRQEVRFAELATAATGTRSSNDISLLVVDQQAWDLGGERPAPKEVVDGVISRLLREGGGMGRVQGYRYVARPLDAGFEWSRPVWMVAVQREAAVPASVYGPLALALLIGTGFVTGLFLTAREIGRRLFFAPMVEAAEAGLWALRHAHGRESKTEIYMRHHPWVNIEVDEKAPMFEDLNRRLSGLQEAARSEVAQLAVAQNRDMDLATQFQQAFMKRRHPDVPRDPVAGQMRLEFFHAYQPARALGGDFFEIEAVAPDCAGIFIGDVMGHGTRSALLTSIIRTLLTELYHEGHNPSRLLRDLNQMLCDLLKTLPTQFFATAAYMAANTTAGIAQFSLAGHPPPFHLHRELGRITRLGRPKSGGAALGVMATEQFGVESVRLVPGDVFVFYTDGICEAKDAGGEAFGLSRLERALRAHIYEDPARLPELVMADVRAFAGNEPLQDDVCLVVVHVTTKARTA